MRRMKSSSIKGCVLLTLAVAANHSQAAPTEIKVDTAFAAYGEMHRAIAATFMQAHPDIKVVFNAPASSYDELFQRTIRGAITGSIADVSFQSYNFVRPLVDRGVPLALDSLVAGEANWADLGYLPNITRMANVGGKVYGLPFNTSIPFIYYNKTQVRESGSSPDAFPRSWDDIASLAKSISDHAGPGTGIYVDYYYIVANLTFDALIETRGGRMMSDDLKEVAFDDPEGISALETLHKLGASGMIDATRDQAQQSFKAGAMGIYVGTSSDISALKSAADAAGWQLGCAAFPLSNGGRYPAGGNAGMITTKDPAKQRAAWQYIKFATGEIGQSIVAKYSGYMPSNSKTIENPSFRSTFDAHPCYKIAVDQLPHVTQPFTFPGPNAQRISDAIRERLRDVVSQKRKPSQVMPEMVSDVKALLPK
ncbi:ABC transporter substrate-binding protein [Bradyrhizobium sp. CCBAU 53421]|uniref:ABC transporter substrate-binding protein n=1 Tax=Bradyrhizobium sp. CCBAU 53421 TaxID=1325120 RepID=UPI00188AF585|nr:ABC transporter substrate-binding protein [Bradyrhizobium sp. CCBAU 53421]QOZ33232.1 ABC transporter substrate-binding protein [Bradyrhizobium sp. CCBAU 53421]